MTTVIQTTFVKLLTAADKQLPTKTALRKAGLLPKERTFVSGQGWRHLETVPTFFKGITLEVKSDGTLTAAVHIIEDTHVAYISIPLTVYATRAQAFRITVHADAILPLVKLYESADTLTLTINELGCLEIRVGRDVSTFCPIVNDTYYDVVYTEAMKPAPVVVEIPMIVTLPAPACSICQQPAYRHSFADKPVCDTCQYQINSYAHKVQARAERLYNRADKLNAEASAGWERAHQMADVIPFGQPILVGHHSEGRDRRYRDRIWNTQKRAYEATKEAERLASRAHAAENNRAISSDDPAAVLKLQEKLHDLTVAQEHMKTVNTAIRKLVGKIAQMESVGHHGTVDEINARFRAERDRVRAIHNGYVTFAPQLAADTGISEAKAIRLLTPDFAGRIGYPDYSLKNNGAEIRRLQKRIEALQGQRSTVAEVTPSETHGDIRLERDVDENRLRLHFPGKPSRIVIANLKSNGFKWSPSNMAWQRQLNAAAEYAAQRVLTFIQEQAA